MAVPAVNTGVLLLLALQAASTVQITAQDAASAASASSRPGVDFCGVSAPLHLTPSSESSLQLLQLDLASSPPSPRPCRLDVTVPPAYELGVVLVPAPVADLAEDDDDDAVDTSRPSMDGRMFAEAVMESVGSDNDAASCTLALYVEDELALSVDLCDEGAVRAAKPDMVSIPHNLSLTWTPPRPGRVLRVAAVALSAVRKGMPSENFCTARPVLLAGKGLESAVALELRDRRPAEDRVGPCRVSVAAPPGYQLSLVLVNSAATASGPAADVASAVSHEVPTSEPSCRLSLMPGCSVLFSVDLCQRAAVGNLNFSEWSPNNVTLEWWPPLESQRASQVANNVILTAIGRGEMCKRSHFAPCQHRPRFQRFCVAAELACDGYPNCPMDGHDEDPTKCRSSASLVAEVPRQASKVDVGAGDAKELIMDLLRWPGPNRTASHQPAPDHSIPDTLSTYGPWGYLMLGMLVCGAFLMLCGLWECCCRQPKASASASNPTHPPTTVLMPQAWQMGATGGVLVLDSDLEDDPSRPPAYEELDQPPAYGALFPPGLLPGQPKDDVPDVANVISPALSLPASLDVPFADDASSLTASTSSMATASSMSLS